MRFGLKASYNRSFWRVQRDKMSKSCSESSLFMREVKALARSCVHAGSSEPLQQPDVIRTIISCADQFIVLIFYCRPLFYFLLFSIII